MYVMSMESHPDLMVLAPDTPEVSLAVEIKLRDLEPVTELPAALAQMRSYLSGMRCPVGVLISWPWTHVLTGPTTPPFATGYQHTKVKTSALLGLSGPPATEKEAAAAAFAWLSRLTTATPLALPGDPAAYAIAHDYLVPAAAGGRIHSA